MMTILPTGHKEPTAHKDVFFIEALIEEITDPIQYRFRKNLCYVVTL